ncbi:MAG: ABC transporter substrate-binding protein, partial [Candidatus Shapirobacteria bacterium]|nr:ABC transporter substrate-binding protein [Candidatus Shapirobacteria bacterium]
EINEDGSVRPGLAESWEIKNDGKEYWFKIKDNLFWQDEKPVTASDINLKFTDVAVTVVDKKTIKFLLKEPFSPFPVILTKPIFKKGLVGTGEYRFKSIKKNGQIVEEIVLTPVKNKSKSKIIFRFYPTEEAARVGFKLGEVDTLKEIVRPEELLNNPQLGDKSTRQALAYATKKRWEPRALGPLDPSSWAYNADVKPYDFDLDNAKKLLASQTNGESKEPLKEIELSTFSSLLPVAEEIKKDWESLGIATKIKVVSVPSDDFQVLLATQEVPPDPDQYLFWHSTQETNIAHYKSPKIDKLLEDGRKELDQEKRKTSYHDFQKFLVEETPVAFLFHPTVYTISKR